MILFLLLQCKVELVGRQVNKVLLLLDCCLDFHKHLLRGVTATWEDQFEIVRLAALTVGVGPADLSWSFSAFSPAVEKRVDQLLSPSPDIIVVLITV